MKLCKCFKQALDDSKVNMAWPLSLLKLVSVRLQAQQPMTLLMSRAEGIRKGSMAAMTPVVVTAGSQKTEQNSNSSLTHAVVTEVTAKDNLNIIPRFVYGLFPNCSTE